MGTSRFRSLHAALLALLAVLVVVESRQVPGKLAKPDYTLYHTMDGVFSTVRDIVKSCPGTMRLDEESLTEGEYSSTLSVVTVEPSGLTPPDSDHAGKMRLLLNFGEHGRELISSEIGLNVLRLLCDEAARAPLLRKYKLEPDAVNQLLQRTVFKIIPMENIRGRERVEQGELCERKNGRGVDPNRNWGVHWGFKEKDYDPAEEFPGKQAFSEPEAALMLRTARALRPHVWASVHSGMDALFMPYDHKAQIPEGSGPAATLAILEALNERTCSKKCATGSGGKSVGYLAHGTATDYMYQELHVPVPMTWEVYGDQKASFEDCFRMFNPLSKGVFDATVESWTAAVFTLLTLLPQHPDVAPELATGGAGSAGAGSTVTTAAGGDAAGVLARSGGANGSTALSQQQQQPQQDGGKQQQGDVQQQQGEGQQQQGGDAAARSVVADTDAAAASVGAGASASADKAQEIAEALKEHLQQQEEEQSAATVAAAAATKGAAEGGGSGQRRGTLPQRGSASSWFYWLVAAAAGCGLASYLWSKPRFRYVLSKHLGASRRRRSRADLVPV